MKKKSPITIEISQSAAIEVLNGIGSSIFSVKFIKRTDGSIRWMTARKGVKRNLKGVGHSYSPKEKNLLCVFDMNKDNPAGKRGAYRMINLDTIQEIHFNHTYFKVI